jgi:ATP/maltotriose-dependent transcriptional regulator MalT
LQGGYDEALRGYDEAFAMFSRLGDQRNIALIMNNRGYAASALKNHALAKHYYQACLQLRRETGERQTLPLTLNNLGNVCSLLGHYDEARRYMDEGLAIAETTGDRAIQTRLHGTIGETALKQGDLAGAAQHFCAGLGLASALQQPNISLVLLIEGSSLLAQQGQAELARDLLTFAFRHPACESGLRDRYQPALDALNAQLGSAMGAASDARIAGWSVDDALACALARIGECESL